MTPRLSFLLLLLGSCSGVIDDSSAIPPGAEGGPCYAGGTCDSPLVCDTSNVCVKPTADPCAGLSCAGHGSCSATAGTAACTCDDGYHAEGLACVADACGDGVRQGSEICDGTDLGGRDCAAEGFSSGTLACRADCALDTSACKAQGPTAEQIDAAIAARRAQVISFSQYAPTQLEPKSHPFDILASTARDGCGPPERAAYMANLWTQLNMFALPPLTRYLYMYGSCLSEAQKTSLKNGLSQNPHWLFAHGTLNHMIMQSSSWYLLAQYFADATWTDGDNTKYTSAQVMAKLKTLLTKRNWRFFQSGHNELLSTTYAMVDLSPLLNLVDFATDPEVKQMADSEATLDVVLLKAHSFHGVVAPPVTRRNTDQANVSSPSPTPVRPYPSEAQKLLWYYFGEPNIGRYEFFTSSQPGPYFVAMLALSNWRPPYAAWWMPAEDYVVRYATPEFSHWDEPTTPTIYGDTYIGRNYVLATGNMTFNPQGYSSHNQTFSVVLRSDARRVLIDCQQPYWLSDGADNVSDGENAWLMDRWSPFVQTYRFDTHRAVLLASIPKADPWTTGVEDTYWIERDGHKDALIQVVQCRIPKAIDEFVAEGAWVFARRGTTFVAIGSLKGAIEVPTNLPAALLSEFRVIKVRQAKTALFVMVDDDGGGTFADFRARAKAAAPTYDDTAPSVTSVDASGHTVTVRFDIHADPLAATDPVHAGRWFALPEVTVSGVIQPYEDTPVFQTPFVKLADGVLSVEGPGAFQRQGPATH